MVSRAGSVAHQDRALPTEGRDREFAGSAINAFNWEAIAND
jgi:hypothetical protein